MITHRVIDLVYTEEEGNVVMNGTYTECNDFIATQTDAFTYQVQPLLKHEIASLNEYDLALKVEETYRKWGNKKSFLSVIISLLLCSYTTNAQLTRDDRNSYFVAGFHAGSDFKHVISGLQLGYRIGNVYLSTNSFFPITSNALAPKMVTFLGGYNVGNLQPFVGASYQTVGRESEQFYRGKEGGFINGWRMVYGLAYYPLTIPVCFSLQKQGKEIISSLTLYKSL